MKRISVPVRIMILVSCLSIVTASPSASQINLKVGGGLGLMMSAGDLHGSTTDYYAGTNYGLGNGINLQGKAKLGLIGFNLTGEIDYASLSNSGNSEPGKGSVELSQKILSFKVGPEFRFGLPMVPIVPYVGVNVALNKFSGETTLQGVAKVPSATYSMKNTSRIGIGFVGGVEVSAGPSLTLDFTLAYNLMNASGKEWEDVNPGVDQRLDTYLALNDDADPLYAAGSDKHVVSNSRSIHSIVFTVSVLFGL
ncbi:MAG TPA: outer membrane beta-barrel protein, partial [Bacteroidota bacterium]|nr:outer membrane beta-barrel protein [Bacteroidota bacterium]